MEYQVKKLPKSLVEIAAEISPDEFEPHYKRACEEVSRDIKIKGFRPGNVPMHIVEQYVDKNYLLAQAQELCIKKTYAEIVKKENLPVIARPEVEVENQQNPFKYKLKVATLPEVKIKDHENIKIPKIDARVSEKDIEEVIDKMKKHWTTYKDVDRAAQKGDRVEVDFAGFNEKGESVENTKSKNHPIVIGQNMMIPGFEEELIGLKKEEKKEFDIVFPKDYHKKDMQGKKMKFKVEIKRVEEADEPELNEELIEKITGQKKSVDELKKEIETNLQAQKNEERRRKQEDQYIEELLKKTDIEIPDPLIDEEAEHILHDMRNEIEAKGFEFEKYLEQTKTSLDELKKKYRLEATRRIKIRLTLQQLIKIKEIKIDKQEIEQEFARLKANYSQVEAKKFQTSYERGELSIPLYNKLALDKLFDAVLA